MVYSMLDLLQIVTDDTASNIISPGNDDSPANLNNNSSPANDNSPANNNFPGNNDPPANDNPAIEISSTALSPAGDG
jgi:hypothetical protein